VKVWEIGTHDYSIACGQWFDDAMTNKLRHKEDTRLTTAMLGATKRDVGDAWVFDRRGPGVDVTPLDGACLARYGARIYAPDRSAVANVW
jgi:hypothetical protein